MKKSFARFLAFFLALALALCAASPALAAGGAAAETQSAGEARLYERAKASLEEGETLEVIDFTGERVGPVTGEEGVAPYAARSSYNKAGALQAIIEGSRRWEEEIPLRAYNVPNDQMGDLYFESVNASPELFYRTNKCYSRRGKDGYVISVLPVYDSRFSEADIPVFNSAVDQALRCVNSGMRPLEKALALHDYLSAHVTYDDSRTIRNAYDTLLGRTAVCHGYALAYKVLMDRCGIPCETVYSEKDNHIWNIVGLDGVWYHVDVTYDRPEPYRSGSFRHTYFLISDAKLSQDGEHDLRDSPRACSDTRYDEGAFWANCRSSVIYVGNLAYYIDTEKKQLLRRRRDGTEFVIFDAFGTWSAGEGYIWRSVYSGLVLVDNVFYWNDAKSLYRWPIGDPHYATQALADVYGGELYGIHCENGILEISVGWDPGKTTMQTMALADMPAAVVPGVDGGVDAALRGQLENEGWVLEGVYSGSSDPAFRYRTAGGAWATSSCMFAGADGVYRRYLFDSRGYLITNPSANGGGCRVNTQGDVEMLGNLYYLNPGRDPKDPRTCYVMMNYIRKRPNDGGLTFYDADGISFYGWMHAEGGGLRFQTRLENIPGVDPYCIFVWHAQYLPSVQHPDHPGDPAYFLPAGWYLFDDNGVRITADGEYDYKYDVDQQMHHYTVTNGMISAIDGVPVA